MDPAQSAIAAALKGNWKEAEELNRRILISDPQNKEALNRLARTYLELGKHAKALANYKKVLKLDPYNPIAQKAISRLSLFGENIDKISAHTSVRPIPSADLFIEEPGKTKTATLIHLGDILVISQLDTGEPVKLVTHAHRVSVETESGKYIGRLPDDLSHRIIMFTRGGNSYSCFIRSASPEIIRVFIKEAQRSKQFKDMASFPVNEKPGYISFAPIEDDGPEENF